jgi:hypothetical protein
VAGTGCQFTDDRFGFGGAVFCLTLEADGTDLLLRAGADHRPFHVAIGCHIPGDHHRALKRIEAESRRADVHCSLGGRAAAGTFRRHLSHPAAFQPCQPEHMPRLKPLSQIALTACANRQDQPQQEDLRKIAYHRNIYLAQMPQKAVSIRP